MSSDYNWTSFRVHSYVNVKPADVFKRWATAEGIASFFIKEAHYLVPSTGQQRPPDQMVDAGDEYHWQFLHDFDLRGKILAVEKDRSVSFTFGGMDVIVTIHPVDSGSLVVLEQSKIPDGTEADKGSSHLNCRSCWVFYMTNLKSVCESGHDLREHDPSRSDSASTHFQPLELA